MREWLVAGGLIESDEGLLLVQNLRRNGALDWSPPGGVVEVHDGESVVDGLTREVAEETGIKVTEWEGPVYQVEAVAVGLGWHLRVEVHRAVRYEGALAVDDPDGIVVAARFVPLAHCPDHLAAGHPWVREPLAAWLSERWTDGRAWRYRLEGDHMGSIEVVRV
jgi:8-oxo-dGTP diphosphatase